MTSIQAAYITVTGLFLKGTDKSNQIYTFAGPFSRIAQTHPGPPFTLRCKDKVVKLMDLEESAFLLQRTKDWIRSLPVS